MFQFSMPFSYNRETLRDYFEEMTGKSISLILTDNSTSLFSLRARDSSIAVRMHWMFLNAGEEIIREMIDFIKTGNNRVPLMRKFINNNKGCLKKSEQNTRHLRTYTQGRFHNLEEIFDGLNNEYFMGKVTASVSWGNSRARRAVKRRTLGSYCGQTDTIRINTVLDRRNVPQYFVMYIVYHEMLHSIMKDKRKNRRRLVHSPEFRKRERLFKDYAKAISWEKKWV